MRPVWSAEFCQWLEPNCYGVQNVMQWLAHYHFPSIRLQMGANLLCWGREITGQNTPAIVHFQSALLLQGHVLLIWDLPTHLSDPLLLVARFINILGSLARERERRLLNNESLKTAECSSNYYIYGTEKHQLNIISWNQMEAIPLANITIHRALSKTRVKYLEYGFAVCEIVQSGRYTWRWKQQVTMKRPHLPIHPSIHPSSPI